MRVVNINGYEVGPNLARRVLAEIKKEMARRPGHYILGRYDIDISDDMQTVTVRDVIA